MSNDITNGQSQNPNPEVEPISSGLLANPEGDGDPVGRPPCEPANQLRPGY